MFDINSTDGKAKLKAFRSEDGRNVIETPTMDKSEDLSKKSKNKAQEKVLTAVKTFSCALFLDFLLKSSDLSIVGVSITFLPSSDLNAFNFALPSVELISNILTSPLTISVKLTKSDLTGLV